jgi:Branched-chain amino acid aminotransferase/4-amino-4-deoxychorismate lyase
MLNQLTEYRIQNGKLIASTDIIKFSQPPVYEVIRLLDGVPMFFEGHMERMTQSLEMIGENQRVSPMSILEGLNTLVSKTNIKNNNIRIEIGRDEEQQFIWTLFFVISYYPTAGEYQIGVKTISHQVERIKPHAKIFRSEFTEKINQLKKEHNAFEVILINAEGCVTEGSRSNLFFVKDNCVYSAKTKDVLEGITRKKILKVIEEIGVKNVEMNISYENLATFDACFLSGTSINILPIASIDDINYASSEHPLLTQILEALKSAVKNDIETTRRLL